MGSIFVAGGAGFIGSCFVRKLCEADGDPIVVLDKLTYAATRRSVPECPRVSFYEGDIRDGGLVRRILTEHRVRKIVNFAAESHVDRSIDAPRPFIMTNIVGTFELLASAYEYWTSLDPGDQRDFRYLQVSTDEVFGTLGTTGKFSEASPYAPNSPYAASKAAGDHLVRAYHHTYGLPVIISNCCNNFGPYQFPEKLIPLTILNAIEGKPLPVYGSGAQVRDWLYVEDHCDGLQLALTSGKPGETYLFGASSERSNLEIVKQVCSLVDLLCPHLRHRPCEQLIQFTADRPGHDQRYAVDSSKAMLELGWKPRHRFDDALERTVKWYLDNSDWVRQTNSIYGRERLGTVGLAPSEQTIKTQET